MTPNVNRTLVAAAAVLITMSAVPARAEGFATTNLQLLQGWGFHDNELGYDTRTGAMTTVTLNHYSTWEYGDNFAFVDLYRGDFLNPNQGKSDIYGEWHPRVFLNKLLQTGNVRGVKNWGVAGEINQARGFYAYMAGAGLDLDVPGFAVAGLNVYYRYDNFNESTFQVSPFWTVPFQIGPVPFVLTGFLDTFLDRNNDIDIMAQPELLIDVGALVGAKANRVHVGLEWYVHHYTFLGVKHTVSSPQPMIQWTVF